MTRETKAASAANSSTRNLPPIWPIRRFSSPETGLTKAASARAILDRVPRRPQRSGLGTRPALERIVLIHETLMQGRHANATTLARAFEVDARTVARDIEFMRDRLHLPIEYVPERHVLVYGGVQ